MERFELPTGPPMLPAAPAADRWSLEDQADPDEAATEAPDAVVWHSSASFDGLLAIGAVAGSATAAAISALAGWTGTSETIAVLVGLDLGLIAGAGATAWLARRQRRAATAVDR